MYLCDEYLFGRAKTGGLGQVTTKKMKKEKPALVLSPLVPSMAGTFTFDAPSNTIESLPAHRSADGYLLPAWPRSCPRSLVGRATVI